MHENESVDELLARVRKTIADSRELVSRAELRVAETDRMLAAEGLTREEVLRYEFTPEQRQAVNDELVRHGLAPFEDDEPEPALPPQEPLGEEGLADRQRKFGMMMRDVRL